ncbi:hypothetical protein FIE12Z_11401 [Fusarium flagelliforme]|uniref:Uncharacterized protein n=1 Tax=Fusarium flagelliforme TaxID=2675880 RepID=A0A395MB96_9HYPO|nr:hypothetical protein FIE12Z_11401 [Fusarium flagelliforme]
MPPGTGQRAPLSDVDSNIQTASRNGQRKRKLRNVVFDDSDLESIPDLPDPPQHIHSYIDDDVQLVPQLKRQRAAQQAADQADDGMAIYELVDLVEDTKDGDCVDIEDDPWQAFCEAPAMVGRRE